MKKFFKSLAILLALTLVIGTIPASAATVSLSKDEVSIWVNKTQDVADCLKNYDSKTMTLNTTSDDPAIAAVKNNVITGIAGGETKVNVVVKNTKSGAVELSKAIAVTVKNHATKDTLVFKMEKDSFVVGEEAIVNLPMFDEAGKKVDYDSDRTLAVTDPDGKAVTPVATKNKREWTVKLDKIGEYKLVASANAGAVTNTKTIKVTEKGSAGINQISSKAFTITFPAESKLSKDSFAPTDIYWEFVAGGQTAVVPFSAVSKVENEGNVATVTMYTSFKAGQEYFVKVNGQTFSFVGTPNGYKDVKYVEIETYTAKIGEQQSVSIKLLNAERKDITTSAKTAETYLVLNEVDSGSYVGEDSIKGIYVQFDEEGLQAEVQAVFSYLDEEIYDYINITSETVTIVALPKEVVYEKSHMYSLVIGDSTKTEVKAADVKTYFAIGDTAYLFGQIDYSDKSKKLFSDISDGAGNNAFAYSADNNVAMVTGTVGDPITSFQVEGVQAGSTAIIVAHINGETGEEVVDMVCPIEVRSARVPSKWDAAASKQSQNLLNCFASVNDKITITVKLLDQYNDVIISSVPELTVNEKATKKEVKVGAFGAPTQANGEFTWNITAADIINASEITTPASISVDVKVPNTNLSKTYTFKTCYVDPTLSPERFSLVLSQDTLETALTKDSGKAQTSTITVKALKNTYFIGNKEFNLVEAVPSTSAQQAQATWASTWFDGLVDMDGDELDVMTNAATVFCVTITGANNKSIISGNNCGADWGAIATAKDGLNDASTYDAFIGDVQGDEIVISATAGSKKFPQGNYKLTLYKLNPGDAKCTVASAGQSTLVVKNSQKSVVLAQTSQISSVSASSIDAEAQRTPIAIDSNMAQVMADCFTLKFEDMAGIVSIDKISYVKNVLSNGTSSVFIYAVEVTVTGYIGNVASSYKFNVPVNKLISLSAN